MTSNKKKCPACGEDIREFDKALSVSRPVSLDTLSRARTKPANTSDVRWRMELRRRANAEHYATLGESVYR